MTKKKKYHFLYKTTNLINNKYYFGVHSTYNIKDGYLGSGKYLRSSINKYGEENFRIEILEFFDTREELMNREKEVVNEKLIGDENCMNLRPGGFGGFSSEEQRKNAMKSNLRQKWLSENDNEWLENKKRKMSESLQKQYDEGLRKKEYFYDWTGKEHKESTKKKIGKKNSFHQTGEGNSQYGTCWVFNEEDKVNKKIKKEELEDWLGKGWKSGRKMKW